MGKLIFCYGSMNSSKSAQLLMWKHNYEEAGKQVSLFKPAIDTREEFKDKWTGYISSRIGLKAECNLVREDDSFHEVGALLDDWILTDVIMVDEAQFLTEKQVDELYQISLTEKIVICFGLKCDFTQHFFSGSKRLFELADEIRELKTVCKCGKKATVNARFDENGELITEGSQIEIGGNEKYRAMCKYCYDDLLKRKGD